MGVAVIQVTTPSIVCSSLYHTIDRVSSDSSDAMCMHQAQDSQEEDPGH